MENFQKLADKYFETHAASDSCHITEDGSVFHGNGKHFAMAHCVAIKKSKVYTYERPSEAPKAEKGPKVEGVTKADLVAEIMAFEPEFKAGKKTVKELEAKLADLKAEGGVDLSEMTAEELVAMIQETNPDFDGAEKTVPELIEIFNAL